MWLRVLTPAVVLATSLALLPATAHAATTTYTVTGVEVSATNTEGVFVGAASRQGGGGTGTWYADVIHGPLPNAAITDGSFGMALTSAPYTITGEFSGGTIRQTRRGDNCTNQEYSVIGRLDPVSAGRRITTGDFNVTLTHHRRSIFGRCIGYAATVVGWVAFA